jgi:hypothetical protein
MPRHFFTRLFHKRCPLCKQEVREQGDSAVQRFGKWYCSEVHADLYELDLYEALRAVHCRHAGCHGEHVPLPAAMGIDCSPRQNPELVRLTRDRRRCFTPSS